MNCEVIDCIDAGTEYCPCHLAEAGECILCSQLQGKCFCDCLNWKGVCIYDKFRNNGSKAKKGRETFNCKVIDVEFLEKSLILVKFLAPHKLALDLVSPGGFIFIRTDENFYFDIPISILQSDTESNVISIMIEVRGIKTKRLLNIAKGQDIVIRGPYWNGVFGLKNIDNLKNGKSLVIAKGIGMAPMLPVIKKLINNGNKVDLIIDKSPYKKLYVEEYLKQYNLSYDEVPVLGEGILTAEIQDIIRDKIEKEDIGLLHCAGADILTYKILDYLDQLDRKDIKTSCCNNAKMCCGEGVCGSCTARFKGHRVKRLCKVQSDPRNIFEGRRFI
ncbi:oxidoreductase [Clostridium polyendosporum]|uniref:Oxidoreductase n=1 Tax=Clostridium polyendosporum TaxID=69208 RepID=A0A919VNP5_9CLOT|nr:sulfide/dihydroorotate dehydrogenase-like FAD/NAD-binding protein [Clostridium polyendosporum]GIM30723.1 oxidoreductase [Clostridium polyendosporum]